MPPLPPMIAARYRPTREVAEGSISRVYECLDEKTGRVCAVKLLKPQPASSQQEVVKRFVREAKAGFDLNGHPAICRLYDVGLALESGSLFIAMELIRGTTLAERVRGGLRREDGVRIIEEVAGAVAYAHERGVIHRDLRPENVLVTEKTEARLIDFGLVKAIQKGATQLTKMGQILGVPAFMAPELITDAPTVTERTDIYGLGVLLYFVLTRQPPYRGGRPLEILEEVMKGAFRAPRELDPTIDSALDSITRWAMANDPEQRPTSANDVAQAIAAWRRTLPPEPRR